MKNNNNLFNKTHIVDFVKEHDPSLSRSVIEKAVDIFFDQLMSVLISGDRIELRGFASWIVKKRSSKNVRNPKTNEKVTVGPKGALYFRASKELLRLLNATH